MNTINDGGPAFPLPLGNEQIDSSVAGMTLRDKFADSVLPAVYAEYAKTNDLPMKPDVRAAVAVDAYAMADAMLWARAR
jgi:hypothetical protein